MALGYTRHSEETWREATARYAREQGLEQEVLEIYDRELAAGEREYNAGFIALSEWDCLDFWEC